MKIIICCNIPGILQRWDNSLKKEYTVLQATMPQDLKILLQESIPDVLLLHHSMLEIGKVRLLKQTLPTLKLFILSDRPSNEEGVQYLQIGAVGYANSYINQTRLHEAVQAIASGAVWVNQKLMQYLVSNAKNPAIQDKEDIENPQASVLAELSNREYQIATLVADGLSNLEIAAQLDITERTVKAHLSSVYNKTGSRGRLNLALLFNQQH